MGVRGNRQGIKATGMILGEHPSGVGICEGQAGASPMCQSSDLVLFFLSLQGKDACICKI